MEITEVKVFPVRDKKLRAFVSIVLDGSFMVNDIKVINGKDGLFISMPSRRKKNGRFKDIAHPLNNETRQAMEQRIIAEYRQVTEAGEAAAPEPPPAAGEQPRSPESAPAGEPAAAEPAAAAEAATPVPEAAEPNPADESEDKSLEEVAEAHLSDSYWST